MMYPLKLYVRDRWIGLPFLVTILLVFFSFWYAVAKIHPSSEQIFLHYSILFGVDLIGEWWKVWFIPIAGLGAALVNGILSYLFYNNNKFLARFIAIVTTFLEILTIVGMVLIIGLNI